MNSRPTHKGYQVWRRRSCPGCQALYTTNESVDLAGAIRVRDTDKALRPFNRDELWLSLYSGLSHRTAALNEAGELCETIIDTLLKVSDGGIIDASLIIECAHKTLKRFDTAAAVHYRAHHRAIS